jgi:7-carboxy-7-deazaguanine synthase
MARLENISGWLHSAFDSIEGEGMYAGARVLLVRLAGCDTACPYCDTREAWEPHPAKWKFMETNGTREMDNPISAGDLISYLQQLVMPNMRYLSLTGGEPMLQLDFTRALAHLAHHKLNLTSNLETSGLYPRELAEAISDFSHISLDIKLPSLMNGLENWELYYQSAKVAGDSMVQVKVVVAKTTPDSEIKQAVELVAQVESHIPFILQPVDKSCGFAPPDSAQLLHWQELALRTLHEVRVVPQIHKIIGAK